MPRGSWVEPPPPEGFVPPSESASLTSSGLPVELGGCGCDHPGVQRDTGCGCCATRAHWVVACSECHHLSPGHHEGCWLTPVSAAEHRRKLLAELADPEWAEMARNRLVQMDALERPRFAAAPCKDRYEHRDGTSYVGSMTVYAVAHAGLWFLNEAGELVADGCAGSGQADALRAVLRDLVQAVDDDHAGDMTPLWARARALLDAHPEETPDD